MKSDIEIAQEARLAPIAGIAERAGVPVEYTEPYGQYKAKVDYRLLRDLPERKGKLILVTAITPTPAGEGKTTTTIGLADGLRRIGKNAMVALREPSLGPVFGIKGGAAGHQSSFYGRFSCDWCGEQPVGCDAGQPYLPGQCVAD